MGNDYKVGYGKPPKNTQFKVGNSGNKKGRPRKRKDDYLSLINLELKEKVPLSNGEKITKEHAIYKQLINSAANGNKDAMKMFFNIKSKYYQRMTCEKFVDKLLKENYLTNEDVDKFLKGDEIDIGDKKVPSAIWNISMNASYKQGRASMAFFAGLLFSDVLMFSMMCFLSQYSIDAIREEFNFYEGVNATLNLFDISKEEKTEIIKTFEQNRQYTRPSQEVYDSTCDFEKFYLLALVRNIAMWKEEFTKIPNYEKYKKIFLDENNNKEKISEYSKTHSQEEIEYFKELNNMLQENYNVSEKEPFSFKHIDKEFKDLKFALEKLAPYIKWVSGNHFFSK